MDGGAPLARLVKWGAYGGIPVREIEKRLLSGSLLYDKR